jgi:hypothetical protein
MTLVVVVDGVAVMVLGRPVVVVGRRRMAVIVMGRRGVAVIVMGRRVSVVSCAMGMVVVGRRGVTVLFMTGGGMMPVIVVGRRGVAVVVVAVVVMPVVVMPVVIVAGGGVAVVLVPGRGVAVVGGLRRSGGPVRIMRRIVAVLVVRLVLVAHDDLSPMPLRAVFSRETGIT